MDSAVSVRIPPCEHCGQYCRQVEYSNDEVWCQYCDRCGKNDHSEEDCTNCITSDCANEKNPESDMCESCSQTTCIVCGEAFTEEKPAVSLAVTMDPKNCPRYFCGVCNELL